MRSSRTPRKQWWSRCWRNRHETRLRGPVRFPRIPEADAARFRRRLHDTRRPERRWQEHNFRCCRVRPDRASEQVQGCKGRRRDCCRSEEHTSELQSLMRNSYAVFCLKKKKINQIYSTSLNTIQRYLVDLLQRQFPTRYCYTL